MPDGKFYITTTLGGFGLRFSLAIKMAVVMCTPMIIWQILAFFLPALRPNERKWVVPTVLASTVLFFLGAIFCYFIIIPAGFEWLIGETSAVATALPDLENYVNMELLFMIGFGVAFELRSSSSTCPSSTSCPTLLSAVPGVMYTLACSWVRP